MRRQAIAYCERVLTPVLQLRVLLCTCSIFVLLFSTLPAMADNWRELGPGIEYIDLGANLLTPWSHVHVFRIDLKNNQLDLVTAKSLSRKYASVDEFAHHSKALLAINGGFFDRNYRPLGLRVGHEQLLNPLKRISWWGVFYIQDKTPSISGLRHYTGGQQIDFAVQSGPRLLVKGRIPSLKAGRAERSALGISPDGRVIIVVTENLPMTTTALAQLLQSPPLNCKDALNLDGGNSSQLFAHIGFFQANVHGFSNVSDAIIVKSSARKYTN